MEDELQKARLISDRMFKAHNERDFDLDWHKERADQLSERWQNIHSQIDGRLAQMTPVSLSVALNTCHCSRLSDFKASRLGWHRQVPAKLQRLLL